MTLHDLRLQFDQSFFAVLKDLVKLEALDEHHIPPSQAISCDLEAHVAAHQAMTWQVARLIPKGTQAASPNKTRPLPLVHL